MYDTTQVQNALKSAQYANQVSQRDAGCAVVKPTVVEEILNRLGCINDILRDVISSQHNLIDRLHGATPVASSDEKASTSPNGHLAAIDEKLQWVLRAAQEIMNNQNRLEHLG